MCQPAKLEKAGENPSPVIHIYKGLVSMTNVQQLLTLLVLLQVKHLIVDWCWQTPVELVNKGNYLHKGGLLHAGKHTAGTLLCFLPFVTWYAAIFAAVLDGVIHYHVDWSKAQLSTKSKCTAVDPGYWWLMGSDQTVHQLTYIFLGWIVCIV